MRLRDLKRFLAASGRQNLVSMRGEAIPDSLEHGRLVVHDQDHCTGRTHGWL
jgi:hypothetical protein